jgi:L-ascorbate metabolism protein UlaG (beta-lactamase superfamily)
MGRPKAHIILNSHRNNPLCTGNDQVAPAGNEDPIIFDRPGEFEVSGVQIEGYASDTKSSQIQPVDGGQPSLSNKPSTEEKTSWFIQIDGVSVGVLSGLTDVLNSSGKDLFGSSQVILCPTGLNGTLPSATMSRIIRDINPAVVIPYGYKGLEDEELVTLANLLGTTISDSTNGISLTTRDIVSDGPIQLLLTNAKN